MVQRVSVLHRAKCRADLSNRCQDIAIFLFSRWRPSAILDLLYACLDHTRRVFGGVCYCANFGWNRNWRSIFNNASFNILRIKLSSTHIHVFGDFDPQKGSSINATPKALPCAETHRSPKSVHWCGSARAEE